MSDRAPQAYLDFVKRFPQLGQAWDHLHEGGEAAGSLDQKTQRLLKLAIAFGARQEGAAHASVRKGLKMGISEEDMEQVAALVASTCGLPQAVACWRWIKDITEADG